MTTRGLLPGDDRFGPQSPGRFDLTLTFENAIFSIGPMSAFILFSIVYIRRLLKTKACVKSGVLLPCKLALATILFGAELAMLALWAQRPESRVQTTLASSIICSVGALFIGAVLYAGHRYSPSPSIPLSIYLSITFLLDIAKTRSFFLREGVDDIASLSVVTLAAKLAIIVAEEVPKTRWIDKQRFPSLSGEAVGGFWSRSMLVWVNDTLLLGFKRRLNVEDLPPMGPTFSSERLYNDFLSLWKKQNKNSKLALPAAWFRLLSLDILITVIPRLCSSGFLLAQPFLLRQLVSAVGQKEISTSVKGGLCGATALVYLGAALSKALYKQLNNRVLAYTRSIVIAALYEKSLKLSHEQLSKSSSLTLMNADVDGILDSLAMIHDIWASVIEFGLGLFILATFIGPACVLMVIPTTLSTYVGSITTKRMASAKRIWNEHIETRVGDTSDVLSQLKGVKVSGMGPVMSNHVNDLRAAEVTASRKERWARILMHAIGYFSEVAPPVVVLAGAIFWTRAGGDFSVAEIFTTLAIVVIVTEPMSTLLLFLPAISAGFTCSYRVQQFLLLDELPDRPIGTHKVTEKDESSEGPAIRLKDATIKRPDAKAVFRNVNFEVAKHQVSMFIGPVGCGKSSLLRCILGEIPLASGAATASSETIAYCDQTPWLQNTTIRNNIVAQSEYSPSWYREVLHTCALDEDIVQLSAGDQTQVGTGGCNLSGGQRQRVALARAVYSRDPILLLDDVVTALDRRTSKAVLERLLGEQGVLRRLKTSVLMTSSSLSSLTFADKVYALTDDGLIEKTDRNLTQLSRDSELLKWLGSKQAGSDADDGSDEGDKEKPSTPGPSTAEEGDGARQKGDVSLYFYYIKSTGSGLIIAWFVSLAVAAVSDRMPLVFLRIWLGKDPRNNFYFIGYALLSLVSIVIPCSTLGVYYLNLVPRSSMVLHERLLHAVMKSRLWYFTKLDTGSVMNRFSSDITIISHTLPKVFMQTVFLFFQIPTDVGIIVAGAKYAAAFVPLLILAIYCVQFYYLRTSRQMRFLDLEARAPLITHFSETASGIQHVRAYSWQREFSRNCVEYLDFSQRPHYYLFCIQAWLGLVLDLIIMGIAVTVIAFALNYKHTTSEAAVGLSMINIITLSTRMSGLLRSWVEMESSLGAVSRTREFVRSTPVESDPDDGDGEKLAASWPQSGNIEFKQVTAGYNLEDSSSQSVVKDVSLKMNHGDKVGIVGRTGSGKSSLMLTLLNFLDYTGSITIDGKELASIPHETLRQRIISISQEGIHLTGSLRKNLDPYDTLDTSAGKPSDKDLIDELSRACVWESINSRGYDLDTPLKDIKLSTGQLQLLAVARAMLRCRLNRAKVILIDEAISNVDDETAKRVQDAMKDAFKGCTVVTIAHRLDTVEDCGLVVEMEGGRIDRVLDRREGEGERESI